VKTVSRRDFLRLSALGAGAALLAACAPKATEEPAPVEPAEPDEEETTEEETKEEPPAEEPVTIFYCSWGTEQKWASEGRCHQPFYDANPNIEVEFVGLAWGPYWQRVLTSFAGGEPVDMFRMEFWKAHAYYSRGVILPLDTYFEAAGQDPATLFLDIQEQSIYDGVWYGTPRGATGNHIIYYNRDMFDEKGIEWPENTPDWTWDEFMDIAREMTSVTGDIETDVWGFDNAQITGINGFEEVVWGRGGDLFNEDNSKCLLNEPEAIEALQFIADMRNVHETSPFPAQLPEGMGDPFLIGKTAMAQSGGFKINIYKTIEDFDWGIATVPAGPVKHVAFSKPNATVITAASEHPDAAWAYLSHINSEENAKCEALEGLWPPNLQDVLMSEWYLTRETPPYNMAPTVPGLLCDGQAPALFPWAQQAMDIIGQEMSPLFTGDVTDAAEVTAIIEEKVNELLETEEEPELT
jgi:multiple sugar transport system substrate-binding protein